MSGHGISHSLRLWLNHKDVEGESSNQDQPPAEGIPQSLWEQQAWGSGVSAPRSPGVVFEGFSGWL